MNQQELITCHCIIAHPSKSKFLVIKHTDRWSPPLLKFPAEGSLVLKAHMINEGMMNKYGLRVTVLRQVVVAKNYLCIELEMHAQKSSKNLKAVWVGSKEFKQFRSSKPGEFDPLEVWLKQKESRNMSVQRPPWERTGWFSNADRWIHHQLDRLNIQVTGLVQQLRVFRASSCILKVPTAQGKLFFKASYRRPPQEAALTQALARNWPGAIPQPLAIDAKNNWMLMRDYLDEEHSPVRFEDYPSIAHLLAEIQMESLDSMETWKKLGCPVQGLDYMINFLQQIDRLTPVLSDGEGVALNKEEIERLKQSGEELQISCRELAGYSIPLMLVHADVWYPNLTAKNGKFQINDWMGSVISHPFFSVLKLLRFRELLGDAPPAVPANESDDWKLRSSILEAYLEPFSRFESKDSLQAVMALVSTLQPAWRLLKWSHEIPYVEPDSFSYQGFARGLQTIAGQMISRDSV